jgi:hypothetical protein
MPSDKLVQKAEKLLNSGRVESLGGGKFNVVGDHGTYIVVQNYDGAVSCNCLGFLRRNKCSHSIAVLIMRNKSSKKRRNKN